MLEAMQFSNRVCLIKIYNFFIYMVNKKPRSSKMSPLFEMKQLSLKCKI